jgi:hypothetical protein
MAHCGTQQTTKQQQQRQQQQQHMEEVKVGPANSSMMHLQAYKCWQRSTSSCK